MRAILLFAAALGLIAGPAAAAPALSDVAVIPIHDGVNLIEHFTADGRAATIVKAWRDNGNAHGYDLYLVMLPSAPTEDGSSAGLVPFVDIQGFHDTAGASPFDGERILGTIRFAHARLNGRPATVMVRADLGESKSGVLADHAPATIKVYRLDHLGVDVGTTPDLFKLVETIPAPGLYCNAGVALAATLHLAAPDTAGKQAGGCFD